MTKRILLGIIPLVIALGGCAGPNKSTLRVGVLMPLTGAAASVGVPSLNAVRLAVDEFNKNKPKDAPSIQLIVEDTRGLPTTAVSSFQRLVSTDGVQLVIGPMTSGDVLACAPIANRKKVVILSPSASAPAITNAGDYVFRNELSDSIGGADQGVLAYDTLGYRKVVSVFINNDYGVGLERVFRNTFDSLGGKVILSESFPSGATDFRSIISKIKNLKPDAIFFVGVDEIINFVQQKVELGLKVPIYTTPVFQNPLYLQRLGGLADGILYVYYGTYNPAGGSSTTKEFVESYESKYHDAPTYYSALSYDATNIMITVLRQVEFDVAKVDTQLYAIKNFQGVTGITSFNRNGDVNKPVTLKVVKNGEFEFYDSGR